MSRGTSIHVIQNPALSSSCASARSGRRHEKHPLFLFLEGVPLWQGWSTPAAGVKKLGLAEKVHRSSEERGCVFSPFSSTPSRGDEGLLTAPLPVGELDAHA